MQKIEVSPFTVRLRVLTQEEIQAEYMKECTKKQKIVNHHSQQRTSGTGAAMDGGNQNQQNGVSQNTEDNEDNSGSGNDNPLAGVLNNPDDSIDPVTEDKEEKIRHGAPNGMMIMNGNHEVRSNQSQEQEMTEDPYHRQQESNKQKVPNILISVKNSDNLDEFSLKTFIQPDYIPKLQKWIEKNKFVCEETIEDIKLKVQIFNFNLRKTTKTETEILKEEMHDIKKENVSLMREMKLFQHYFFNFWKDRSRDSLLERPYLVDNIVESPQNLYNMCEGLGYVEVEQYNGKIQFYIGFRQPVPFLYHTGNSRTEEMMMQTKRSRGSSQSANPNEDWFEVFISGKGFPHNLCNISSKTVKQVVIDQKGYVQQRSSNTMHNQSVVVGVDQQMLYLHKTDINVTRGSTYTIYTPKLFS